MEAGWVTQLSRITGAPPGIQMGIVQIITTRVIPRRGAIQSGVGWTVGMNLTAVARNQSALGR